MDPGTPSSRSIAGEVSLDVIDSNRDARLAELIKTARYFRRSPLALLGTTVIVIWILVSLFAGVIAP